MTLANAEGIHSTIVTYVTYTISRQEQIINISKWEEYNQVEVNAKQYGKWKRAVHGGIGNCTCCLDTPVG
jgi:hypothetical protein